MFHKICLSIYSGSSLAINNFHVYYFNHKVVNDLNIVQKTKRMLISLGKLVSSIRSISMVQTELALRTGVGRNTISSIEIGRPVNAETLFKVLEQLDWIDELQQLVDQMAQEQGSAPVRKSRKIVQELDNDF